MAKQLSHDNKFTNKPWDAVMHPTINIETFLFFLSVLKPAVFGLLVMLSLISSVHGQLPLMSESAIISVINLTSQQHVEATSTIFFGWYNRNPAVILSGTAKLLLKTLLVLQNYMYCSLWNMCIFET